MDQVIVKKVGLVKNKDYASSFFKTNLSLENLSPEHVGCWSPIKGKAIPSKISYESDIDTLKNGQPQMIVATPGRWLNLVNRKVLSLDDFRIFDMDGGDKVLAIEPRRADTRQMLKLTPREDQAEIYECSAGEISRWRPKMDAPILKSQWTGQGSQKYATTCSWAPDWGQGPDPDPIINYNYKISHFNDCLF